MVAVGDHYSEMIISSGLTVVIFTSLYISSKLQLNVGRKREKLLNFIGIFCLQKHKYYFTTFTANVGSSRYEQVGIVSGGVSECGDKNIPSYFTRLDHPEIAAFIMNPEKHSAKGNQYYSM